MAFLHGIGKVGHRVKKPKLEDGHAEIKEKELEG